MSNIPVSGPGDKPTKRYEPIDPEEQPIEPVEPGWESPDSDDR